MNSTLRYDRSFGPRIHMLIAAAGLCATIVAVCAGPSFAADLPRDLDQQHQKYIKAQKDRDYATVLKLVTADFVLETESGQKIDHKMLEKAARARPMGAGGTREQVDKVIKSDVSGSRATVVATQRFTSHYVDIGLKPHTLVSDATFREQWVRVGGQWKLRHINIVSHAQTVDGKSTPASKPKK